MNLSCAEELLVLIGRVRQDFAYETMNQADRELDQLLQKVAIELRKRMNLYEAA